MMNRILLSSKDSIDRRSQVQSAYTVCKEAFLEVSVAYVNLLDLINTKLRRNNQKIN